MAVSNSDGSIILSVKIDQAGFNKEMAGLQGRTTSLTGKFKSLAAAIGLAFSVAKLVEFSKESAKLATQTEASVQRLIDIYGQASKAVGDFIDQNAMALGMSRSAAASFSSVYGNLFSVWADQATNAKLTNDFLNQTAVIASKTGRTMQDVQERIRSGLLGNTEAVEDLGVFVNVKTIEITEAFRKIADGRSWEQLNAYEQQQVRALAILEQSTKKYGNQVSDTTALTRARFQAAWEDFMNTWGQIVNQVLMPIMKWSTVVLVFLTRGLQILAGISKETVKESDAVENTVENQEDLNAELKKTQKEQRKVLAGFDEINTLTGGGYGSNGFDFPNYDIEVPEIGEIEDWLDPETLEKLERFEKWVEENRDNIITALEIGGVVALGAAIGGLIGKIGNLLGWFSKKDKGLQTQTNKTNLETSAVSALAGALAGVSVGVSALLPWLDDLKIKGENLVNVFGNSKNALNGFASSVSVSMKICADNVRNAFYNIATNIYNSLSNTGNNINSWVSATGNNFYNWCSNVAKNIGSAAKNIADNFGRSLSSAWENFNNFMKATGEKISTFWNENKTWIVPVTLTAVAVGAGIALAPYTGGASLGLAALAKGGVVPTATTALIGEAGKEVVLPLENHTEWMDDLVSKLASAVNSGNQDNRPIILQIDGREIARATREGNASLGTQTVFGGFANAY